MQLKTITETFIRNGKIVRKEKTRQCATFDEAAEGLQYGKVIEMEYDDGTVEVVRSESELMEQQQQSRNT